MKTFFVLTYQLFNTFTLPFSILPRDRLSPNPSTLRIELGVPDSDIFYVGQPESPVLSSIRSCLHVLLDGMNSLKANSILRNNRATRERLSRTPFANVEDQQIEAKDCLHKDKSNNMGAVTNTYPLLLAFREHGIFIGKKRFARYREEVPPATAFKLALPEANQFLVDDKCSHFKADYWCAELGLVRDGSQSWLQVPEGYRARSEI